MSFRDEIEGARAKLAELEDTLAQRDARVAELNAELSRKEIGEKQRIQIRRLETAITAERRETEQIVALLRAQPAQPRAEGADDAQARTQREVVGALAFIGGVAVVVSAVVGWLLGR